MTSRRLLTSCAVTLILLTAGVAVAARQQASDEDVARRQLESGRAFAKQGNYAEALKDFTAVADTHASTASADNALIEIARYYFDVADSPEQADAAVNQILKKYPTSDSAAEAYLIGGQLALARSRQTADLEIALANFDRVSRLFPASEAVPRALQLAGHIYRLQGKLDAALATLVRVAAEHGGHTAAMRAYLETAITLVAKGDPIGAIEELQQVRNRWPESPEAQAALGQITTLYRLHVRAKGGGPAFSPAPDIVGPPKLQNVVALGAARGGAVYWATESGLGLLMPPSGTRPPTIPRPRGLTADITGQPVAIEAGALRPFAGKRMALAVTRPGATPQPLGKIDAAVQLSGGDWVIADDGERQLQRFRRGGEHVGAFATARVRRLAANFNDEVVGVDREEKQLLFFDASGKPTGRIRARGAGYLLENIEDVAFDTFGHLYVLDRTGLAVFSPWLPAATTPPPARGGAAPSPEGRGAAYQLLTLYREPDSSPGAFRRATALAVDDAGIVYVYDERAERIRVYR